MANKIIPTPLNSESPSKGADRIREFKIQVNELLGPEHDISDGLSVGDNPGFHGEQITGKASGALDTPPTGYGRFLWRVINGITELFHNDDAGSDTQITRDGKVNLDKNIIANDTPLQADNEAGDGLVDLIKAGRNEADDADVMFISDGARTDTDAAPLEDTGVANKKYVDDNSIQAWVQFSSSGNINGTGSGVASVVRNSEGSYTVTWTTAFSDENYSVVATPFGTNNISGRLSTIGTTAVQVVTEDIAAGGSNADSACCIMAIGNQ